MAKGKAKSQLIANRSAHAVVLASDGVASRRSGASKVKKDAVEAKPATLTTPALSRPVRSSRHPVNHLVESVATQLVEPPLPMPEVAAPPQRPRSTKPRTSTPQGPTLSDSTQTRMREMNERLQAVRQQLANLQNKKRPASSARRST